MGLAVAGLALEGLAVALAAGEVDRSLEAGVCFETVCSFLTGDETANLPVWPELGGASP